MKALIVDPRTRSVQEVEYDGTVAGLAALYPYNRLTVEAVNQWGDHMMFAPVDNNGTHPEAAVGSEWGVNCGRCEVLHRYAGVAVLFGTLRGDPDEPQDPVISARGYLDAITWNPQVDNTVSVTIMNKDGDWQGRMTPEELIEFLVGQRH